MPDTYRAARIAAGRCRYCTGTPHGGTRMCWKHRVFHACWKSAKRLAQKGAA